jgi:hypothetical protein
MVGPFLVGLSQMRLGKMREKRIPGWINIFYNSGPYLRPMAASQYEF